MSRPGAGAAVAAAPPGRLALALRLPVLVAVTGALGLAGHVLADRELPPPRLLALGLAVVALLALPLRRRQAGPALIAGSLLGGQAALHLVLCLCHCTGGSPFADLVHRVLCPDDVHAVAWAGDPLRVVPGAEPTGYLAHAWPGHAMVLAHVAAALAAAWWLRRGEAAAHAALTAVPSLRLPTTDVTALPAPARVPVPALAPVLTDQVRLLLTRPRRGPPVVVRPV